MAVTIITKHNATTTNVPADGEMTEGELAVNTTDRRIFTKNESGNVKECNQFGDDASFDDQVEFTGATSASNYSAAFRGEANTGTLYHIKFMELGGTINGTITSNGYATAYATTSDYRLKSDLQTISNPTTRVKALNPINFLWTGSSERTDGFLAHEVAAQIPEAVVGNKDAEDGSGNPVYQSIDQSKIIPVLVACIQELEARITVLES